ncbi:hypothetical protein KAT36_01720 [Candidatus Pacearchaeota archaeon]|nr:hypothetical protein [Candidatus Pacearchaeota archaeon]
MAKRKNKIEKNKIVKEKEGEVEKEVGVGKVTIERENRQMGWFIFTVIAVFALVLIPYFWVESSKSFEFGNIDWVIEDYENLRIFHGRFLSFTNSNLYYNVFLRGDPRKNDIYTEGNFDSFKYGGIISVSPEVDSCRGELSRVMLDLGAFLKRGAGVGVLESGSTDEGVANESGRRFVTCGNVFDRTVVIVEIGEARVLQDDDNSFCYTVYAEDCNDVRGVERFMVKAVEDFRD